jgi:WD40 repeat protein
LGHRGIITKLAFFPGADDTLKLISCAEDFVIRVWDLVMKKEIGQMKPKGKDDNMAHMTTSIVFTSDRETIISGGKDGCLHFWNAHDNFKHISTIKIETLGGLKYDEIN